MNKIFIFNYIICAGSYLNPGLNRTRSIFRRMSLSSTYIDKWRAKIITNITNQKVKFAKAVCQRQKKEHREKVFLEGHRIIIDAISAGDF